MKREHTLGIGPRGLIVEKDANIFIQSWVVEVWHWWKDKVFFLLFEWSESQDIQRGKRFLCQHQRGCEITQQFHPSGGTYQTWRCVELQKQMSKRFPQHSFLHIRRGEKNSNPWNNSTFSYHHCLGKKVQITSPAFKLKSTDNLQNKKQRAF